MIRKRAFSLIEVLIVLSLIVVILTVSIPRFEFLNEHILSFELEKLFTIFIYLQQSAIASNKILFFVINEKDQSYVYSTGPTKIKKERLADKIKFGFIDGVCGPPGNPIKRIDKAINLESHLTSANIKENNIIKFLPSGRITAGTIYLVDKVKKHMAALTSSVSYVSYIRKYKYENFKWRSLEN